MLGSTPASDQVCQISRRPPLLCQCAMSVRSCVSTVLTTTYQAGGSTVTDHYSNGRMGLGLQNMLYDLCWTLGQGLSCMFIPDCKDMLGGGWDALCGMNFTFLRINFLLPLCPLVVFRESLWISLCCLLLGQVQPACQTGSPDCCFFHKLPFFLVSL